MAEELEERCSRLMQQRLRKYDIVEPLTNSKEIEDALRKVEEYYKEENVKLSGDVMALSLLKKLYLDSCSCFDDLFNSMCGVHIMPGYIDESVPEFIRSIHKTAMDNLSIFLKPNWEVYEKDVLRAVAYHDYVSNFKIGKDEI